MVVSLFGPYSTAEANDGEDEDPDELGAPESQYHDVVVVHGPQFGRADGRHERAGARDGVGGEEHRAAGDQDGELEEEGEQGAVGLRDAPDGRPAAPDAKQAIDDEQGEAGLVEGGDQGQARALGLAVDVTVSQIQQSVEALLHHAEVVVHIDRTCSGNIGVPVGFAVVIDGRWFFLR